MKAFEVSLKKLGLEYLDLLLLHQQVGDYMGAWKNCEKAVAQGKVKSIGLSNFESGRLEEVCEAAVIKPAVLQVECHPYFQQNELKKRLAPYGTVIEAWYPIGHGDADLIGEPVFTELAQKYGKTNVQVILRWHIQEGTVIFPKSTNLQHIRDNFDIFDFELTGEEMERIRSGRSIKMCGSLQRRLSSRRRSLQPGRRRIKEAGQDGQGICDLPHGGLAGRKDRRRFP